MVRGYERVDRIGVAWVSGDQQFLDVVDIAQECVPTADIRYPSVDLDRRG
jgi:hypothetical protein